jgi:hypothetical protein
MTLLPDRVDLVVLARVATSSKRPSLASIVGDSRRFSPPTLDAAAWTRCIDESLGRTASLDARAELTRRLGLRDKRSWKQLTERVLPALGLGLAASDDKIISRLTGREEWTAAIAGRALGIWSEGAPPSLSSLCDAYAWRCLALPGRPKRCPPEVRAVFLQRELQSDAGPPDRLLRLFVARELDAARPELRVIRDALVRNWLLGKTVGAASSFADDVRHAARSTSRGVFGQRKVFISAVWEELRRAGRWSTLSIADFKTRLLDAQRAGGVELARADLVAAMDPRLVADSETLADGASFHFIVREEA